METKDRKNSRMEAIDDIRIEPLKLTENCRRVLESRYLKKDESGKVTEKPEELFGRVAETLARVEVLHGGTEEDVRLWRDRFYKLMTTHRFMPNSPTLMNAGREMGMLSACFVLPVPDSIDGIFDSIKHTAIIQKAGGGTGFAFDELRPTGDYIKSSGGTTSGPISFWRAFSEATNAIQQGAFRRGANMGMMYIHHPDILKFLHAKQDLTAFTNYNISVKVTDEWMEGFLADPDSPHIVRNPRTGDEFLLPRNLEIWKYDVRSLPKADDPKADRTGVYTKADIWKIIITNAHATGEPGVVFIDRINQHNPTPHIGRMEATNPCGEQPLLPYEACNLGSVNLGAFVVMDPDGGEPTVDWERMRETVHYSVRFLDNVVDANDYQLPQIDAMCKGNRKIGLGIMGFADALFKLGAGYNTQAGCQWGERFMKFINDEAHAYSEKLAEERGCFPNFKGSTWDTVHHRKMRNACCTTVAPTGTISIIAGCSGGIEPMFSLAFFRNVLNGQRLTEVHEYFREVAKARGFYSDQLMDRIAKEGTLAHIDDVPADIRDVFVCAHDISPEWHMRQQAAFQQHCDSSISKTINFPHEAEAHEVEQIYRMAYSMGCKGVTVYRDGCREHQPMALDNADKLNKKKNAEAPVEAEVEKALSPLERLVTVEPVPLPDVMSCIRIRQMTPFGNMHLKITVDPKSERELEVFAQLGKGGDVANSDLEAICRLLSLFLRCGGPLRMAIKQLDGIGSSLTVPTKTGRIASLGDGLAKGLLRYLKAKEMFGLKNILLGEFDLAQLDARMRGAEVPPATSSVASPAPAVARGGNGKSGNGHGKQTPKAEPVSGREGTRLEPVAEATGGTGGQATAVAPALSKRQRLLNEFKVKCPECQSTLSFAEGCVKCHSCGYSQC
ncbi:MAG: hypothetical protein BIFFINMI_02149 [Phycisphaerae bacterium]|nr:hypothetical protein [Phycisphaerae bacterium]